MCGNGVKIGMKNIVALFRPILQVQIGGLTACSVVVAGSSLLGSVVRHTVPTARLPKAANSLGSALSSPNNDFLFRVIHSYS